VPKGARAIISATAVPPAESTGLGSLDLQLVDAGGNEVGDDIRLVQGTSNANIGAGVVSATVRTREQSPPGRYAFWVELEGDYGDVPIELGVQFLKPGETIGLVRAPGALGTPTPTATPRPRATAAAPADGGSGGVGGWLVVAGVALAGIAVGLIAAAVLARRVPT
jgi:hypothetical protein